MLGGTLLMIDPRPDRRLDRFQRCGNAPGRWMCRFGQAAAEEWPVRWWDRSRLDRERPDTDPDTADNPHPRPKLRARPASTRRAGSAEGVRIDARSGRWRPSGAIAQQRLSALEWRASAAAE